MKVPVLFGKVFFTVNNEIKDKATILHTSELTHTQTTHTIDSLSLEESNIKDGGVKVNKLEDIHLSSEVVIKFGRCAMKFCNNTINTDMFCVGLLISQYFTRQSANDALINW